MARILLFGFLLLSFFSTAQVVDTAATRVEVDSLVQLNRKLVGQSKFEEALQVIEIADSIALMAFGENHALFAQCQFFHGRTYYFMGKYDKAESLYLKALALREKVLGKGHRDYAWSLNNLAALYMNKGEYDKAKPLYLESLAIREKVLGKEHPDYAASLNALAVLYMNKGEYDKAEPLHLEAKAIREKVLGKEHPDYAASLNNLAVIYFKKGEYNKAETLYLEAKVVREKVLGKEHPDYAGSLINLAILYFEKGDYDKAEPAWLEAKTIREKILGKEHPDYAASLVGLATLYHAKGEYDKAEPLYLEAKAIREKVLGKEHPDYAVSLNNLAALYWVKGEYDRAEPLYLEAKAIMEKVLGKEHPDYAVILDYLANLYSAKGDYDKAEHLFLEAKAIQEKVLGKEHRDYAASLNGLALLNEKKGKYDKAESLYLESLAIREKVMGTEHPDYVESLHNLALLYQHLGQSKKAEQYFIEGGSITKRILQKSATYLPSQELEKHIALYQDKNEDFYPFNHKTTSDTFRIASYNNTLFYKGFTLETANYLEQAMQSAPDSIRDIHSRWKGYNRQLAVELAKPIAERKHFAYLDSMSNVLEKVLLRATPAFAEAQRQIVWQDVRDALQPGEAAIEFIHYRYSDKKETDSTMYSALVTMPGGIAPQFIPLCEARQLDAIIYKANGTRANYLQNLYASPRADGLQSLNQLLWTPIVKVLRDHGVKTVYYSPTGLLHRLNLGAIAEGKSGSLLADNYRLVPMGSTRQLAIDRSSEPLIQLSDALIYGGVRYEMDSSAIIIANANLNAAAQDTTGGLFSFAEMTETQRGDNWDYLSGTEQEARYLDNLLRKKGVKTTLRLGYNATEESFKKIGQNGPSPSLLHIGTHGFFFPDPQDTTHRRVSLNGDEPVFKISEYSMIRSGLKLAGSRYAWENGHPLPGGHEDGILTAYEVSQMNLSNTQLVVLSACETGLGDIRGNEGVYGLQRAFRIAGAKNVLMSLWKVPDNATQKLMTRFYDNWFAKKKPLRESFEEAQKWLRGQKGFENPYFWAGFVLVGEL